MSDDSRKQFEAEFRKSNAADPRCEWLLQMYNHGTDEDPEIDYYSLAARDAWKWWKASRAALVVELPEKIMVEDDFDSGHNCAIDYCAESLRAAGATVKGEGDDTQPKNPS